MQADRHKSPDLSTPWVLPGGPSGVTVAREAARRQMTALGVTSPEVVDTAELIVSELTSNAVKHAGGQPSLCLLRTGDVIRIEVCDANARQVPVEREVDVDAESGRGLLLVSRLATAWGYRHQADQKCTWAEVEISALASPKLSN